MSTEAIIPDYSNIVSERDFLSLLIDLYRNKPVLWKVKHENYSHKGTRQQALESIVNDLREYKPDYTIEDFKKRINIMRTNFNKERHKLEKLSKQGHDDPKTTLWYFNELLFLADQPTVERNTTVRRGSTPMAQKRSFREVEENSDDEQDYSYIEPEIDIEQKFCTDDNTVTPAGTKTKTFKNVTVKKIKEDAEDGSGSDMEQYMTITTTYYKKKKTKEQLLAKNWALKLGGLSQTQKIYAEKIINDVLYQAELGNLCNEGVTFPNFQ